MSDEARRALERAAALGDADAVAELEARPLPLEEVPARWRGLHDGYPVHGTIEVWPARWHQKVAQWKQQPSVRTRRIETRTLVAQHFTCALCYWHGYAWDWPGAQPQRVECPRCAECFTNLPPLPPDLCSR